MIRTKDQETQTKNARVLVFGNEKGGCGKSTAAMHVAIGLLRLGFSVGSLDLDGRQASFSRYLKNRFQAVSKNGEALPSPEHISIPKSTQDDPKVARVEEATLFTQALNHLMQKHDFVVIDTPGYDCYLNRLAHSFADTIITPINDSFIDIDLLTDIDANTLKAKKPNIYSEMVWEQRKNRAMRNGQSIEWIVMRNRVPKDLKKKDYRVEEVLGNIQAIYGFTPCEGFTEREIFRDLFLKGITLLDFHDMPDSKLTLDIVQARQEIRTLLETIGLRKKVASTKVRRESSIQQTAQQTV